MLLEESFNHVTLKTKKQIIRTTEYRKKKSFRSHPFSPVENVPPFSTAFFQLFLNVVVCAESQ